MARNISAARAMALIGDDPATLLLAIHLMDRMLAKRHARATTSKQSSSMSRINLASESGVGAKQSKNKTGQAMTEVVGRAAKRLRRY